MLFLLLAFTAFTVSQHASNFVPFAAGGMAARMDAERRTGGKRVESSRVSRVFVKIFRLSSLRRLTRSNQRQAKNSTVQRNSQKFSHNTSRQGYLSFSDTSRAQLPQALSRNLYHINSQQCPNSDVIFLNSQRRMVHPRHLRAEEGNQRYLL